jgi:hypothetical protein
MERIWKRTLVIAVVLVVLAGGWKAVSTYLKIRDLFRVIKDGYRETEVVGILVAYMEQNGGAWPANWESLEIEFRKQSGYSPSANQELTLIKERIEIDFSANADDLRARSKSQDGPDFRVVYPRFTSEAETRGNPNELLYRYFRGELKASSNTTTADDSKS